jgi:hypothetical protein
MASTNSSMQVTRSRTRQQSIQQQENNSINPTTTKSDKLVVPRKHHIKKGSSITALASWEENVEDSNDTGIMKGKQCLLLEKKK